MNNLHHIFFIVCMDREVCKSVRESLGRRCPCFLKISSKSFRPERVHSLLAAHPATSGTFASLSFSLSSFVSVTYESIDSKKNCHTCIDHRQYFITRNHYHFQNNDHQNYCQQHHHDQNSPLHYSFL